jgi:hypothetical protein
MFSYRSDDARQRRARFVWIAGDAAYSCENGLFTPWSKVQLLASKEGLCRDSCNYFHSSLRMHVEKSFGMLVARFGVLWKPLKFSLIRVAQIISACMRMHNCFIDNGAPAPGTAMKNDEKTFSEAVFTRWWNTATALRDDASGGHRRRNRLE